MGSRLSLHSIFTTITPNVYFQPPPKDKMNYPCIVYSRNGLLKNDANGKPYMLVKRYQVTVIDLNPDSTIPDRVIEIPNCSFVTHFTKDNLNHDVYNIYY